MEQSGRYVLELAQIIPIKNINFYIDTYIAMRSVDVTIISQASLGKIGTELAGKNVAEKLEYMLSHLSENGADRINALKALGKSLITEVHSTELNTEGCPYDVLPFIFLTSGTMADLKIHGRGSSYEFIKNLLDDLSERDIIDPALKDAQEGCIESGSERFSHDDLATLFLGYSISSRGALRSIIRFPSNPTGFVAVLMSKIKCMLPKNSNVDSFFAI